MTWKEFVAKVNAELAERGISEDSEIEWINWSRTAFGGEQVPDVYINVLDQGRLGIGED